MNSSRASPNSVHWQQAYERYRQGPTGSAPQEQLAELQRRLGSVQEREHKSQVAARVIVE